MSESVAAEVARLRETITRYDHLYYVLATPEVSDQEYDRLFRRLRELEAANPELADANSPTARVGAPPWIRSPL